MGHGKKRISYWIDRRLTGLAGPEYHAIISFGLPIEPEDSQYGKYRIDVLDKEATAVFESLHKPLQDAMLVVWQERFKREIVSKYVRRGSVLPALVRQYSHPIAPAELEHYPKSYVDCASQVWNRVVKAIPPHMRSVDAYLDEREQATLDRLAKTPSGGLIRVYSDTGFGRLFWELVADDILVLQLSVTACYTVPFEEEMAETLRENARRYLAEIVYKREGRSK